MDQMMNNPQMMAMAQKLMSDPEIMMMLQKPGVMQKFQQAMGNPALMAGMYNDPEVRPLLDKLQALQMQDSLNGGGMGGAPGMGGMGGMGGMAGGAAAGGGDGLVHVNNSGEFFKVLSDAGSKKLVVVDFYTDWCGPCKAIAPAFARLANAYSQTAVFVKVNCDKVPDVAQSQQITAYPTFKLYLESKQVDEMKGASEQTLTNLVSLHTSKLSSAGAQSCPYTHFPLKESEAVGFASIKYDALYQQLMKYNTKQQEESKDKALSEEALAHIQRMVKTLQDKYNYHSSKISADEMDVVQRLLSWEGSMAQPGLQYLRMLARHPDAAGKLALDMKSDKGKQLLSRLCELATQKLDDKGVTALLATRALCNLFSRRNLSRAVVSHCELLLDSLTSLGKHSDKRVRFAYAGVLINLALLMVSDNKKYADEKVHLLSTLMEIVSEEQDAEMLYRWLVIIGTLVYRDESCTEIANGLELSETLSSVRAVHESLDFKANQDIAACCSEIAKALSDPSA